MDNYHEGEFNDIDGNNSSSVGKKKTEKGKKRQQGRAGIPKEGSKSAPKDIATRKSDSNTSSSRNNSGGCSVLDSFSPKTTTAIQKHSHLLQQLTSTTSIGALDDFDKDMSSQPVAKPLKSSFTYVESKNSNKQFKGGKFAGGKMQGGKGGDKTKEEGWQEVSRKYNKLVIPGKSVSRLIGRAGCNINAIREFTKATIDLNKMKNSNDSLAMLKGSPEAIQLASKFIEMFIEDPDADVDKLINQSKTSSSAYKQHPTHSSSKNIPSHSVHSAITCSSENILIGKTYYSCSNPWKQVSTCVPTRSSSSIPDKSVYEAFSQSNPSVSNSATIIDTFSDESPLPNIKEPHDASSQLRLESDDSVDVITQYPEETLAEEEKVELLASASFNGPLSYDSNFAECLAVSPQVATSEFSRLDNVEFKDAFGGDKLQSELVVTVDDSCLLSSKSPASLDTSEQLGFELEDTLEYSPFNNRFSAFMHARNKESKKDFASVAAPSSAETSFLAPSTFNFSSLTALSSASTSSHSIDSELQAKAPGFRPAGYTAQANPINLDSMVHDHHRFPYEPSLPVSEEDKELNHLRAKPLKELQLGDNFNAPENIIGFGMKSNLLGKHFVVNQLDSVMKSTVPQPIKSQVSGLNPEAPKFTLTFNRAPTQPSNLYDPNVSLFNSYPFFNQQYNSNSFGMAHKGVAHKSAFMRQNVPVFSQNTLQNSIGTDRPKTNSYMNTPLNLNNHLVAPSPFMPLAANQQELYPLPRPYFQHFDNHPVNNRDFLQQYQKIFEPSVALKNDKVLSEFLNLIFFLVFFFFATIFVKKIRLKFFLRHFCRVSSTIVKMPWWVSNLSTTLFPMKPD